ncbi:MAG: hypothetical protein ACJ754_27085 [Pyrinomonadaceae bacterium]
MAMNYANEVRAFIYFSGETEESAREQVEALRFEDGELFSIHFGPNRIDEPKYRLPLAAGTPFICTLDDDRVFGEDTLTILMDAYNEVQKIDPQGGRLAPVGWSGTEIGGSQLLTPIEDRYNLSPGQLQKVDYVGSCGCLYRREILEDERLRLENWPDYIGYASDVWLSYLVARHHHSSIYITGLNRDELPEHGHSLFADSMSDMLPGLVERLVAEGWKGCGPINLP